MKYGTKEGIKTIIGSVLSIGFTINSWFYAPHYVFIIMLHVSIVAVFVTLVHAFLGGWSVE